MGEKSPKSSYELALEKLKRRDAERGEAAPTPLTDDQKNRIAEIRRRHTARVAEREILYRSEREKILQDPEAETKLPQFEEDNARERRRMEEQTETEIAAVRSGGKGKKGGGRGKTAGLLAAIGLGAGAIGAGSLADGATPADPMDAGARGAVPGTIRVKAARYFDGERLVRRKVEVLVHQGRIASVAVEGAAGRGRGPRRSPAAAPRRRSRLPRCRDRAGS